MKTVGNPKKYVFELTVVGVLSLAVRWGMVTFGMDEKGLIPVLHPLKVTLYLVTALAAVLILSAARKGEGSGLFEESFARSLPAALGHGLAAAGIGATVLLHDPAAEGLLGLAWLVFGYASAAGLVWAAICRASGRRPFFLCRLTPCLYFLLHIINHYQTWSGDPQLTDYLFDLLAILCLMFFSFHQAAFDLDQGDRRKLLTAGLGALYLCIVNLYDAAYPLLYAGCAVWAAAGLWQTVLPRESE